MQSTQIQAWIPIRRLLRLRDEPQWPNDYSPCINNFIHSIPTILKKLDTNIIDAKAVIKNPEHAILHDIKHLNGDYLFHSPFFDFIQLEITYSFASEPDLVEPGIACALFPEVFIDSIIIANLAFPGRIHSATGRVYIDDIPMNTIDPVQRVTTDLLFPEQSAWPPLQLIDPIHISDWKTLLEFFNERGASTSLKKALSAFTHLIGNGGGAEIGELLFWAVQGLEAFYCRGNGDLRKQLSEKSKIFLGPWEDKNNIVGKLYDIRSKFVHGDFDLVRWNNRNDIENQDKKNDSDLHNAASLGIRMLFATLQKAAVNHYSIVEFEYLLSTQQ